jgi:hypothetical protein
MTTQWRESQPPHAAPAAPARHCREHAPLQGGPQTAADVRGASAHRAGAPAAFARACVWEGAAAGALGPQRARSQQQPVCVWWMLCTQSHPLTAVCLRAWRSPTPQNQRPHGRQVTFLAAVRVLFWKMWSRTTVHQTVDFSDAAHGHVTFKLLSSVRVGVGAHARASGLFPTAADTASPTPCSSARHIHTHTHTHTQDMMSHLNGSWQLQLLSPADADAPALTRVTYRFEMWPKGEERGCVCQRAVVAQSVCGLCCIQAPHVVAHARHQHPRCSIDTHTRTPTTQVCRRRCATCLA